MRLRHPHALDDDSPPPDDRVHYGQRRDTAEVDDDGTFTVPDDTPDSWLEEWADGYDCDLSDLLVDDRDGDADDLTDLEDVADADVEVDDDEDGDDEDEVELCGAELASGGTCERPADECPYH